MRKFIPVIAALFLMSSFALAETVIVKDLLYVDSETEGRIWAYDTTTQSTLWVTNLDFANIEKLSISADKTNVYVGIDAISSGGLMVLDAQTGAVVWSATIGYPVYSAPTVTKDYLYVGTQSGVWVLDKITGNTLWWTIVGPVDSSPAVDKGIVYANSSDNGVDTLYALRADTGEILFPLN